MVFKTKTWISFFCLVSLAYFIFFLPASSGLTFRQNSAADIKSEVRLNGAVPPASALCNISVYYPNNSILVDFRQMTNQGSYFNYTINSSQTSLKGNYNYCVTCSSSGLNETDCSKFIINLGGIEPSQLRTDTSTRNIYIFLGLGLLAFLGFFLTGKLPVRLTLLLIMIWFILMGINSAYISMQDEILNENLENFFSCEWRDHDAKISGYNFHHINHTRSKYICRRYR